jgi:sulfide:quinone oxidoreductase
LEETLEVATRVLIAGGGVAALEAALALRALAEDRVRVELLAPEPQFGIGRLRSRSLSISVR